MAGAECEREEGRAGRAWGRRCKALWASGKIWTFPLGGGSPGGVVGTIQVPTGALWWPPGKQPGGWLCE